MAIEEQLLNKIKMDFYTSADCHSFPIQRDDPFWDWFRENASIYSVNHDAASSLQTFPSSCFGNAQAIAIKDNKQYIEGFTNVCDSYIQHGFNASETYAEDHTVNSNPSGFKDHNGNLPSEYIGVAIPHSFITSKNDENLISDYIGLPFLISEYYLSQKKITQNKCRYTPTRTEKSLK